MNLLKSQVDPLLVLVETYDGTRLQRRNYDRILAQYLGE